MRLRLSILLSVLLLAVPALAQASPPQRASMGDIEDEVMCLVCGTTLNVSDSPQGDRERVFIRALIARGETKKQILDALVAQYGRAVLATPSKKGFDLAVWIVPGLAVLLAAGGLAVVVTRWRHHRSGGPGALGSAPAPASADGARLRSDLERYDL